MSRLEQLIQELCPNGVEFHPLRMVARYANKRVDASQVDETTYVGVENLLQNKQGKVMASSVPQTGMVIAFEEGDILIGNIRPYLRKIWLADCDGGTNGDVLAIQIDNREALTPRFLYYVLSSEDFFLYDIQNSKGAKMPRGSKDAIMNYQIPVPPVPVQREIVRILDNFTELSAELSARKQQYDFYRDKLLTFNNSGTNEVIWRSLSDIADIGTGSSNTNEAVEDGQYPFYVHSQDPLRKNAYEYDEIAIITAGDGVGVGKVYHYVEGKYALHQRAYRIHITVQDVLPRYCFHYMSSKFLSYIQKTMFQGSVSSIRRPMLSDFPIPVPSIDVQERIVKVLDNFEAICSDLNIGLPAEIEARKKQYEYYRDMLLTFMESGGIILTENREQRTENREQRTENREQRTENI